MPASMETTVTQQLQFSPWIHSKSIAAKPKGLLHFSRRLAEQSPFSFDLQVSRHSSQRRTVALKISCSYKNSSVLESGNHCASVDESLAIQRKSREIESYLNGRCIYLVGMMGSGKTTVGKVLSNALGYSFSDSDSLVEQDIGISVAEIFKVYGEDFFRERETEALRKLSLMHQFVISTGGGAVTRTINWKYMHKGISVWLDVPLEALVKRISVVGTSSRPLLHHDSTDAYTKTLVRLSTLLEERGEAYANAKVTVSCEKIAAKLGTKDVSNVTPMAIAIEALEQIEIFLKREDGYCAF
ncbi:shikimate kinase, chloroplastic-like [Benincasa hispida]|uniref:shikimate kinase, chloroplastic-like n=1 Tax=Benincasa hispida TaxID=102211 RepID=UPI0018FFDF09|nr:shikimate kinase, chloroplastic-like [Benincasa hispida]XP_038902716.1 shikimate kinase, chloroplastic-like [Benincasa hispida]